MNLSPKGRGPANRKPNAKRPRRVSKPRAGSLDFFINSEYNFFLYFEYRKRKERASHELWLPVGSIVFLHAHLSGDGSCASASLRLRTLGLLEQNETLRVCRNDEHAFFGGHRPVRAAHPLLLKIHRETLLQHEHQATTTE